MNRVFWTFTSRTGGVSEGPFRSLNLGAAVGDDPAAVAENRRRALRRLGLPGRAAVAVAHQEHGNRVLSVAGPFRALQEPLGGWHVVGRGDALLTGQVGLVLAVLVADCAPVLLADEGRGWVGAVHAGWRGLAACVIQRAVEALCRLAGTSPERLVAAVGPCIRACCYQVGPEVAQAVGFGVEHRHGRAFLDVAGAAVRALEQAGLQGRRIQVDGRCTACRKSEFFSYRRDGARTGRMAGLVARLEGEGAA